MWKKRYHRSFAYFFVDLQTVRENIDPRNLTLDTEFALHPLHRTVDAVVAKTVEAGPILSFRLEIDDRTF